MKRGGFPHRGKPRGAEFVRNRHVRTRGQHEVRFHAGLAELAQGFGRERRARGPGDADDDFHGLPSKGKAIRSIMKAARANSLHLLRQRYRKARACQRRSCLLPLSR